MSEPAGPHTALVTGANHGIGAAAAIALARQGGAVLCSYLRIQDEDDPGTPARSSATWPPRLPP